MTSETNSMNNAYSSKLSSIEDQFKNLTQINSQIRNKNTELKQSINELKNNISLSYKQTIEDLEKLIEHISNTNSNQDLNINAFEDEEEGSPAMLTKKNLVFNNGTKVYTLESQGPKTFTINKLLGLNFSYSLRANKCNPSYHGYTAIGLSNREILDENKGYLGQEYGQGTWAISPSTYIGEDGKNTQQGIGYKEGDIITFTGSNGVVTYMKNHEPNSYSYDMKTTNLYPAFTLYGVGDQYEILD